MQPFDQTPEAQEYLTKLQGGRAELPAEANDLEREILKNLREKNAAIRQLATQQGDTEKEIAALQGQLERIRADLTRTSGEMGGYARLLVSTEGGRRLTAETPPADPESTDKEIVESGPPAVPPGMLSPDEQKDRNKKGAEANAAKARLRDNTKLADKPETAPAT